MTTALTRMLPLSPAKFPNLPSVSIRALRPAAFASSASLAQTPDSALATRPQASERADSGAHADAAQT